MPRLTNKDKEDNIRQQFDAILLDIASDVQKELLKQCRRSDCDDLQTDTINENTIATFELNKKKYLNKLMGVSLKDDSGNFQNVIELGVLFNTPSHRNKKEIFNILCNPGSDGKEYYLRKKSSYNNREVAIILFEKEYEKVYRQERATRFTQKEAQNIMEIVSVMDYYEYKIVSA